MERLDYIHHIKKVDKHGMLRLVERFPEEFIESLENSKLIGEGEGINFKEFSSILIGGLGGSAIVGDLVIDWLKQKLEIPMFICRDYHLPSFVHEEAISIIVSYSGETEEALNLLYEAYRMSSTVFCITSGGKMEELCLKLKIPFIKVKPNLPPRAALPNLLGAMLLILQRIEIIKDLKVEISHSLESLKEIREKFGSSVPSDRNPIKRLAFSLLGKIPIIYSIDRYSSVAKRLKNQLNENSKVFSISGVIPEVCHNEVEGLAYLKLNLPNNSFIFIRFEDEFPEELIRVEAMKGLLKELGIERINEIKAMGKNVLGTLLSGVYQCDYLSVYLAIARGIDPYPIECVNRLKGRISSKML
ncbi:MAG: bifunctional phosphoglucose/phosphomannose isomerase [Candidatus Bathyarchaeia archaeon]